MHRLIKRSLIFILIALLLPISPNGWAAPNLDLPKPGQLLQLSQAYDPMVIKGITVHPENPFRFDFIIDPGQNQVPAQQMKAAGKTLINYFLASLAIPEKDVWVNLSPYEKERVIPDALSKTHMGQDLLAQDYLLKQMTASLAYPETDLGRKFWDKVYVHAKEQLGITQIPTNAFNKVWIKADKADIFVHGQTAIVVKSHLKVMIEQDYLAMSHINATGPAAAEPVASEVMRSVILPVLEHEINEGKHFANLRQMFHALILATWFKKHLKEALLNQVYTNQSKIKGIDEAIKGQQEKTYQQYLQAYKKGVFNLIKEAPQAQGSSQPRKYFAGGIVSGVGDSLAMITNKQEALASLPVRPLLRFQADLGPDEAMSAPAAAEPSALEDGFRLKARSGEFFTVKEVREFGKIDRLIYTPKGIEKLGWFWDDTGEVIKNDSYANGQKADGTAVVDLISKPIYIYVIKFKKAGVEYEIYAGRDDIKRTFIAKEDQRLIDALYEQKRKETSAYGRKYEDLRRGSIIFAGVILHEQALSEWRILERIVKEKGIGDLTFEQIDQVYEKFNQAWQSQFKDESISMEHFFRAWGSLIGRSNDLKKSINDPVKVGRIAALITELNGFLERIRQHDGFLQQKETVKHLIEAYLYIKQRQETIIASQEFAGETMKQNGMRDAVKLMSDSIPDGSRVYVGGNKAWLLEDELRHGNRLDRVQVFDALHPPKGERVNIVILAHPFNGRTNPLQVARALQEIRAVIGDPNEDLKKAPRLYLSLSRNIILGRSALEDLFIRMGFTAVEQAKDTMYLVADYNDRKQKDRPSFRYGVYALTHAPDPGLDAHWPMISLQKVDNGSERQFSAENVSGGDINWDILAENGSAGPNLKPGVDILVLNRDYPSTELVRSMDTVRWFLDYADIHGEALDRKLLDKLSALRGQVDRILTLWDVDKVPYLYGDEFKDFEKALNDIRLSPSELEAIFPSLNVKQAKRPYVNLNFDRQLIQSFYRKMVGRTFAQGYSLRLLFDLFFGLSRSGILEEDKPGAVEEVWKNEIVRMMEDGIVPTRQELMTRNGVTQERSQQLLIGLFVQYLPVSKRVLNTDKTINTIATFDKFIKDTVPDVMIDRIIQAAGIISGNGQAPTRQRVAQYLTASFGYFRAWHQLQEGNLDVADALLLWINEFWGSEDDLGIVPEPETEASSEDYSPDVPEGKLVVDVPQEGPVVVPAAVTEPVVTLAAIETVMREAVVHIHVQGLGANIKRVSAYIRQRNQDFDSWLKSPKGQGGLLGLIHQKYPGITRYEILVNYGIYVPLASSADSPKERRITRKSLEQDFRYMSFEGDLTVLIWFYSQLTDQEFVNLGFSKEKIEEARLKIADIRDQWDSQEEGSETVSLAESQVRFVIEEGNQLFEFSKLPKALMDISPNLKQRMEIGEDDRKILEELYKVNIDEEVIALLKIVSMRYVVLEQLKQGNIAPFLNRPIHAQRKAMLSFLSAEREAVLNKRKDRLDKNNMDYIRMDESPVLGWGELYPIIYEATVERFEQLFAQLGLDFDNPGGLAAWLKERKMSLEFYGIRKEFAFMLGVIIKAYERKNLGLSIYPEPIALEMYKRYPAFRQWVDERETVTAFEVLGGSLIAWIREEDPGVTDYDILKRYGILIIPPEIKKRQLAGARSGKLLQQSQVRFDYPDFEVKLTAALWFLAMLNDEEIVQAGMKPIDKEGFTLNRPDLVRKFRWQVFLIKFLWEKGYALTEEEVKMVDGIAKIKFDYTKLPEDILSMLSYYYKMATDPKSMVEWAALLNITDNVEAQYKSKLLKDLDILGMYGDLIKQVLDGTFLPDTLFSAVMPLSSKRRTILAYLSYLRQIFAKTIGDVREHKRNGIRVLVSESDVASYFNSTLFGPGKALSGIMQQENPDFENYTGPLAVLGDPISAEDLRAWFQQQEAEGTGIRREKWGIKIDSAMAASLKGGIDFNGNELSLNIKNQTSRMPVTGVLNRKNNGISGLRVQRLNIYAIADARTLIE